MRFELYKHATGIYNFRLIGDYVRYALVSNDYTNKTDAMRDMEEIKQNLGSHQHTELRSTDTGEFYFEVLDENGKVLARSCLFHTLQGLREKLSYLKSKITGVPVFEK